MSETLKNIQESDSQPVFHTEKAGDHDIAELVRFSREHHNFIRLGDSDYSLNYISKPREVVSYVGRLDNETKLALVHQGYLITDKTSYEFWKKTNGSMRGSMNTVIDLDSVVFHGENEDASTIIEVAKSYVVARVHVSEATQKAANNPGCVYSKYRCNTRDDRYFIRSSTLE